MGPRFPSPLDLALPGQLREVKLSRCAALTYQRRKQRNATRNFAASLSKTIQASLAYRIPVNEAAAYLTGVQHYILERQRQAPSMLTYEFALYIFAGPSRAPRHFSATQLDCGKPPRA